MCPTRLPAGVGKMIEAGQSPHSLASPKMLPLKARVVLNWTVFACAGVNHGAACSPAARRHIAFCPISSPCKLQCK